jgi:hypothetical protein
LEGGSDDEEEDMLLYSHELCRNVPVMIQQRYIVDSTTITATAHPRQRHLP